MNRRNFLQSLLSAIAISYAPVGWTAAMLQPHTKIVQFSGGVSWWMVWSRVLSNEEIKTLVDNPYQIFDD